MMQGEYCRPGKLQQAGKRIHHRREASGFTQQNSPSLHTGVLSERLCLEDLGNRFGANLSAGQSVERGNGRAADGAICAESLIVLEIPYCRFGVGSEYAIKPPGVEPEIAQAQLEISYVIAAGHRRTEVEHPVAETEMSVNQRSPGLLSTDSVLNQATRGLKFTKCLFGGFVEDIEIPDIAESR